jgi:hypothetical protein
LFRDALPAAAPTRRSWSRFLRRRGRGISAARSAGTSGRCRRLRRKNWRWRSCRGTKRVASRHPPSSEQEESFASQCLEDVDAAITRLFDRFDIVESLDVDVLHPASHVTILSGRVSGADFVGKSAASIAMRLKMAGLAYEFGRGGLQPVPPAIETPKAS